MLALLMVLLTTGITVTQHYCHNRLQNTGIFTIAESCKVMKNCCGSVEVGHCKSEQTEQDNCCKNENVFVKFLSQFTVSKFEQVTVFIPCVSLFEIFSFDAHPLLKPFSFFLNHPPSPKQDIQVLLSSFLL